MVQRPTWFAALDRNGVVADALAATTDQPMRDGRPWCPPRVARALVDIVIERDARLPGAIQQAVRLARLLRLVDGTVYWAPLYRIDGQPRGLVRLTAQTFRSLCPGLDPSVVMVDHDGVTFREAALRVRQGGELRDARIAFASMPVLAALLRVLHDSLRLDIVAEILEPVVASARPLANAHEVGTRLSRAMDGWLSEHLDTAHQMRQARAIRAFLAGRKTKDAASIDDETILAFWQEQARRQQDQDLDGFRLFTTAARKMIQYRAEIRLHRFRHTIAEAEPIGSWHEGDAENELWAALVWTSPLAELSRPPADQIKWLTGTEHKRLQNYLGGADASDPTRRARRGAVGLGLSIGMAFDLSLARTLLRADIFGEVQGRIVQGIRDGLEARSVIDAAVATVEDDTYRRLLVDYQRIRQQVRDAMMASVAVLARHGHPNAVLLMRALNQSEALEDLKRRLDTCCAATQMHPSPIAGIHHYDENDIERIGVRVGAALKAASRRRGKPEASELTTMLEQAHRVLQAIRRLGFDEATAERKLGGYIAAVEPLILLDRELGRLVDALARPGKVAGALQDADTFRAIFSTLYQSHRMTPDEAGMLSRQNAP